jgi:hypothetical protein
MSLPTMHSDSSTCLIASSKLSTTESRIVYIRNEAEPPSNAGFFLFICSKISFNSVISAA